MDSKVNFETMCRGGSTDFFDKTGIDVYRCDNNVLQDVRPTPFLSDGMLSDFTLVPHYESVCFLKQYEKLISSFKLAVENDSLVGVSSDGLRRFLELAQDEEGIEHFSLLTSFLDGLSQSLGVDSVATYGQVDGNRKGFLSSSLDRIMMDRVALDSDKKIVVWDNHVDVVACILIVFLRLKGFEVCVVPDGVFLQQRYVSFLQDYCDVDFYSADETVESFDSLRDISFQGVWSDKLNELIARGKDFICEFCGDGPVVQSLMGGKVSLDRICFVAQQTNAKLTRTLQAKMKKKGIPFYDFNKGYIKEKELCGTAINIIRAIEEKHPDPWLFSPWEDDCLSVVVVWGGTGRLGRRIVSELEKKNRNRKVPFSIIVIDPSVVFEHRLLSVNATAYAHASQVRAKNNRYTHHKLMHIVAVATGCSIDKKDIVTLNHIFHTHEDRPLFAVGTHDYDADTIPDCVRPFNQGYMANFILDRPTGFDYLDMVYSRHAACLVEGLNLLSDE